MRRVLDERFKDRAAAVVIRLAGGLVVVLVAAILVGIAVAAWPLFSGARLDRPREISTAASVVAVGWSDGAGTPWWLDRENRLHAADGRRLGFSPPWEGVPRAWHQSAAGVLSVIDGGGRLFVGAIRVRPSDDLAGAGAPAAGWRRWADPLPLPSGHGWSGVAAGTDSEGGIAALVWGTTGSLLYRWGDSERRWDRLGSQLLGTVRAGSIADGLGFAAVVNHAGGLQVADLTTGELEEVDDLDAAISHACFLVGGGTLVAATVDGRVAVILRIPQVRVRNRSETTISVGNLHIAPGQQVVVRDNRDVERLTGAEDIELAAARPRWQVVRRLPTLGDRPTAVAASPFDRTFAVAGERGTLAIYHSTAARRLLRIVIADRSLAAVAFGAHGNEVAAAASDALYVADLHNPHPEASVRSLFQPVWYEGYAEPRLIWQSTGGSDDFEPKLSLWPLILGTLKATVYAMLISVPLALLAAVYVSLLAPRWLQAVVKPSVELMAAVPTVVVGFLAALWLAPRLEAHLFQWLVSVGLLPAIVLGSIVLWRLLPLSFRNRAPDGAELLLLGLVATGVLALGWRAATAVEAVFFAGDFPRWLFSEWGARYDQRNAIVVGIALGFAVIPVIFTIAEDACSSVPKSLTRAARALGATRWQAAMRMVVPAASPGLFAAVMLGLGRAIGETMIVLMASGNTPILGMGPFDGMRTMAAAIAFEIPEAAVGSTLYRVLFLAGLLLFVVTFLISTLADLVSRALRRRYASF